MTYRIEATMDPFNPYEFETAKSAVMDGFTSSLPPETILEWVGNRLLGYIPPKSDADVVQHGEDGRSLRYRDITVRLVEVSHD